jgi:hypothetical protein
MQLEISVSYALVPHSSGGPLNPCTPPTSPATPGAISTRDRLFLCDPTLGVFIGSTASVRIRAVHLGSNRSAASVDIDLHGETDVLWNTLLVPYTPTFTQQVVSLEPTRDATLYEASPSGSNGAGDFLWAGYAVTFPPPGDVVRRALRSTLAFNVHGEIPETALVDAVQLELEAIARPIVRPELALHRVAPDPLLEIWVEGDADAPEDEFVAGSSSLPAATWLHRISPDSFWTNVGGDPLGPPNDPLSAPLLTFLPPSSGPVSLASPALTAAVADMAATGADQDGFLLTSTDDTAFFNTGASFASRDRSTGAPQLVVTFTPTEPYQEGAGTLGTTSFLNEGQDLRWIYDLDHDDILYTGVGGICTVLDTTLVNVLPYSYQFTGDPTFTGHDCCTWQVDSPLSGTVGTGQAIFFHNLDPANPANMPPDSDFDGIRDLCDNCPTTANGPLRGTCQIGTLGAPCRSDPECGLGGRCNLSQEDSDFDFTGNVCEVPEPGVGVGLLFGGGFAGLLGRGRRTK